MKLSHDVRNQLQDAKILRFDDKRDLFLAWYGGDSLCAFDLKGKIVFKVAGFGPPGVFLKNDATCDEEERVLADRRKLEELMSLRVLRAMEIFQLVGRPNCQQNAKGEWEPISKVTA